MNIEVKLYAYLHRYIPNSVKIQQGHKWGIEDGATVDQVLKKLNFPEQTPIMILVNSISANRDRVLREGDVVYILPQMVGG